MLEKNIIAPTGGLNTDDDPRYLPEGDYLKLLNMRTGTSQDQGDKGMVESFLSHYDIEIPCENVVNFVEITVANDDENRQAFILGFQGGATPYFEIYKFTIDTDQIIKIYRGLASSWGIHENTKIYNPRILDGKLVFTDNETPIKYIDLARIEKSFLNGIGTEIVERWLSTTTYSIGKVIYYAGSYFKSKVSLNTNNIPTESPSTWQELCKMLEAYGNIIDVSLFTLTANPPLLAAQIAYINNSSRQANNLRQKTFQVSYRYTYVDYRKSTYSPPSIVPAPDQQETPDGQLAFSPTYHNGLSIQINAGNEEVRGIELIARSSEDPAAWFIIGEIQLYDRAGVRAVPPRSLYTYQWYNDSARELVDASEVYRLFTYVPITSKHMELIEGNRLAFAYIKEGYDRVQVGVTVDLSYEDLSGISTQSYELDTAVVYVGLAGGTPGNYIYDYKLVLSLPATKRIGTYYLWINAAPIGTLFQANFNYDGSGTYPDTVKNGLIAAIADAGWSSHIRPEADAYKIAFFQSLVVQGEQPFNGWNWSNNIQVPTVTAVNKYPITKGGTVQNFGIIYRDGAGRISPIAGVGEISVYIPYPTENASVNIKKRAILDFNINQLPPTEAESYEIVYSGNRTVSWWIQLIGTNLQYGKKMNSHDDPALSNVDTRNLRITVEDMYKFTRDELPNWSVEQYVWEKGDRIRIIGRTDQFGQVTEESLMFDSEIMGVFLDTDYESPGTETGSIQRSYLYFQSISFGFPTTPDLTRGFADYLIEIYRPYKEFTTTLYYTTGMTFEIGVDGNGNKYHKGNTDQVLTALGEPSSPAIVRNTAHDGWKYLRNFVDKITKEIYAVWIESEYASDYYLSQKLTSSGVPIPDLDNFKQSVLSKRLRHGGKYNFGTELNQIAKFDYDDFKDVKDEHGPIEGIREVGFILKVLQHKKVSSIYISRMEAYGGGEESQFLFTDKVFGSLRPEVERFGTRHPESVCVHKNNLYFWDQMEGAVIRDTTNGAFPISSYKMFKFFLDKSRWMESEGPKAVYFSYNVEADMLFCTFMSAGAYDTIVFSENENRWKFSTDCILRKPFWFGRRMFHLHQGKIYEWWRDEDQGYFELTGEEKTGEWIIVSNKSPLKLKHYNALAVYQKGQTPVASVKVPEKASAVSREMETIVAAWNEKEGVFYGSILRDVNTPGLVGTNDKYMNGLRMRGQYCEIKLSFTEKIKAVKLFMAMVTSTYSERSM